MNFRLLDLIQLFYCISIIASAEESLIYITLGECPESTSEITDFAGSTIIGYNNDIQLNESGGQDKIKLDLSQLPEHHFNLFTYTGKKDGNWYRSREVNENSYVCHAAGGYGDHNYWMVKSTPDQKPRLGRTNSLGEGQEIDIRQKFRAARFCKQNNPSKYWKDTIENKLKIGDNKSSIDENKSSIDENKSSIEENKSSIDENKSSIDVNKQDINTIKQQLAIVVSQELDQQIKDFKSKIAKITSDFNLEIAKMQNIQTDLIHNITEFKNDLRDLNNQKDNLDGEIKHQEKKIEILKRDIEEIEGKRRDLEEKHFPQRFDEPSTDNQCSQQYIQIDQIQMKTLQDEITDKNKGDEIIVTVTDKNQTYKVTVGVCFFEQDVTICNVDIKIPYTNDNKINVHLTEIDYQEEMNDTGSTNIQKQHIENQELIIEVVARYYENSIESCQGSSRAHSSCQSVSIEDVIEQQICNELSFSQDECIGKSGGENDATYSVLFRLVNEQLCEPSCGEQKDNCQSCSINGKQQFKYDKEKCIHRQKDIKPNNKGGIDIDETNKLEVWIVVLIVIGVVIFIGISIYCAWKNCQRRKQKYMQANQP